MTRRGGPSRRAYGQIGGCRTPSTLSTCTEGDNRLPRLTSSQPAIYGVSSADLVRPQINRAQRLEVFPNTKVNGVLMHYMYSMSSLLRTLPERESMMLTFVRLLARHEYRSSPRPP